MLPHCLSCFLFLLGYFQASYAQEDDEGEKFKVITADPWIPKLVGITAQLSDDSPETLKESLLFGNNLIRCGDSSMPTPITLDSKMLPAFGTDAVCNRKLTQLLTSLLPADANPKVVNRPTPASSRHEAILTSVPHYVIPDGCVKLTRKSLKVTKFRLAYFDGDDDDVHTADKFIHYASIPFSVVSAFKLIQPEHHFFMRKPERTLHSLEAYEEPDGMEVRKLWKLLCTLAWNIDKSVDRLGIVPKITGRKLLCLLMHRPVMDHGQGSKTEEHIEECTVTDTEVLVVAFTMTLSYPKPSNDQLLKLRNDDPEVYEDHATRVDSDVEMTLTQMELNNFVWSYSLDLLEAKDESLDAWIFVKMRVNKMPPNVAKTYIESRDIKDILEAEASKTTGRPQSLKPRIYNSMLTKSRIGCPRKRSKEPAE